MHPQPGNALSSSGCCTAASPHGPCPAPFWSPPPSLRRSSAASWKVWSQSGSCRNSTKLWMEDLNESGSATARPALHARVAPPLHFLCPACPLFGGPPSLLRCVVASFRLLSHSSYSNQVLSRRVSSAATASPALRAMPAPPRHALGPASFWRLPRARAARAARCRRAGPRSPRRPPRTARRS